MACNRRLSIVLLAGISLTASGQTASQPSRGTASQDSSTSAPSTRSARPSIPVGTGLPGTTVPGTRPVRRGGSATGHREPCWQVAGISKAAMQKRRTLALQTRQEVEAVCANASLTAAQKQQRIREIHQQERQQMQALITPQQEEALRACRQERGGGVHAGGGHIGGHGAGPCGSLPGVVHRENESESSEDPPDN
jgi:hypothetical protein